MLMEKKLVKIGEAAKLLGTSPDTLRKWEVTGELLPKRKTQSGTRYYDVAELQNLGEAEAPTDRKARETSQDQKEEKERQQDMLEAYCAAKGWCAEVITDLGSGMNYRKKGLNKRQEKI